MQQPSNLEIKQTIGEITDGSAIGVQIKSLTVKGSFIVRPPKDQTPQPPDEQIIHAYLESTRKLKVDEILESACETFTALRDAFRSYTSKDINGDTHSGQSGYTAAQLEAEDKDVIDLLKPLWGIPFRARKAEDARSEPLYEAIQMIFEEGRCHGANQRLVLLADPGMGKSPALHEVQRHRAEESLKNWPSAEKEARVIPFYIKLADLRSGQSLPGLLEAVFERALAENEDGAQTTRLQVSTDQMIGLLDKYICLFLFDDMDELLSTQQAGRLQALENFMSIYWEHQYVLTCRVSSYRQQLGSLQRLYLDGLTKEDLTRRKGKQAPIMDKEEYNRLNKTSAQLVYNRSMLESYIVLDKSSDLVRVKGRFLQTLLRYRLKKDEAIHQEHGVDSQIITPLLEHLAIRMRLEHTHDYSEEKLMQLVTDYLERWHESCSWRQVLSVLQDTELLEYDEENRTWRFRDRVDEALFACGAVLHGQLSHQELLAHVPDYWWRDAFEILVGLVPDAQSLMLDIIDKDVLTAGNCIMFVSQAVSDAVEEALIDSLQERISRESSNRRKFIVERIGRCAKSRAAVALLQEVYRDWSSMVVTAAIKALLVWAQRCSQDQEWQLDPILEAEREVMHAFPGATDSVYAMLCLYPLEGHEEQVDELCEKLKDQTLHPRLRGLAAIGLGFADTEQVTKKAEAALLEIFESEEVDDFVAWCVVEALTQFSQGMQPDRSNGALNHPQTWRFDLEARIAQRVRKLYEQEESDDKNYSRLRARAVYLLGWLQEGTVTGDLMKNALADENPFVRGYIVDAIARKDVKDARQTIENLLSTETHPFVLRKATEALGQIGTLESIIILDKYLNSRQASARWSTRAAILEILERFSS